MVLLKCRLVFISRGGAVGNFYWLILSYSIILKLFYNEHTLLSYSVKILKKKSFYVKRVWSL